MNSKKCHEFVDNVDNLKTRLNINSKYGNNNLKTWLSNNLKTKNTDNILDIGCGEGTYLLQISKKTTEFCLGIDYDANMIKKAKNKLNQENSNIDFCHMDMDDLVSNDSIIEKKFDLIYSAYAFYYSKDAVELLIKLKNKLNSKGRICIVGPHGDNNAGWFRFLSQYMKLPDSIIGSSSNFMDIIEQDTKDEFSKVASIDFINKITLPTFNDLKMYWESNIYYNPEFDNIFSEYAKKHFSQYDEFSYFKKAKMITFHI